MGNVFSKRENNLELYLNEVHEKECVFKAGLEEVEFIQTGIETLVQEIVDGVSEIYSGHLDIDKILREETFLTKTKVSSDEDFSTNSDKTEESNKRAKNPLIKVGSVYEETKNDFPDQFDFIFLPYPGKEKEHRWEWSLMKRAISWCISTIIKKKPLHYTSPNGIRKLYLNTGTPVYSHGSACILEFIYTDVLAKNTYLYVNLVPAYKILRLNNCDITRYVAPKSFHDQILAAENFLFVDDHITFAEAEVTFMRNVLSPHHKKVYRILKFLINGHGDDKTMEKCSVEGIYGLKQGSPVYLEAAYTSYMIKTVMIYHHDECRNFSRTNIGPCVLQVLDKMSKYDDTYSFPSFEGQKYNSKICLVGYLRSLIKTLKSMQTAVNGYSYERYRTSSVTMQFLEQEHACMLEYVRKQEALLLEYKKCS